jgi:hypothetical protein
VTTDARWIRSATWTRRYIGFGDRPGRLYRDLDYLTGVRSRLERIFLGCAPSGVIDAGAVTEDDALRALAALGGGVNGGASALLLWTGYYKDTWMVGPLVGPSGRHFVKVFKTARMAEAEVDRIALLTTVVPQGVSLTGVEARSGVVVTYGLVKRLRRPLDLPALLATALRLGDRAAETAAGPPGTVDLYLRHAAALAELGGEGIGDLVRSLQDDASNVPRAVAHGDLTPWNVLRTSDGPVLVDYERVGLYPIYYDVVHCLVQVAVEDGRTPDVRRVERLLREHGVAQGPAIVRAGLLSNIAITLDEHDANPGNRVRTARSLSLKLQALRALA